MSSAWPGVLHASQRVRARTAPRIDAHMRDPITFRGTPRTSEEWAALAKVARGDQSLTREELRRLFMLGLVDRQVDRIRLSKHGCEILGLSDPEQPLPPPERASRGNSPLAGDRAKAE